MNKFNSYRIILVLLILFLMPIDFFSPTANILREAGAKPFNLFVLSCSLFYIFIGGKIFSKKLQNEINVNRYLFAILGFGFLAFLLNILTFDYPQSNRLPEFQFFSQLSMFLMFIFVFQGLTLIFSSPLNRQYTLQLIPAAILIHLLIIFMEFCGIFNSNEGMLSLFRGGGELFVRPSGLMSEPSYFGAFAGLYAIPLIFINKFNKIINGLIFFALILISIVIEAKTFVVVFAAQLLYLMCVIKNMKILKTLITLLVFVFIGVTYYVIFYLGVLNLEENMSSVMRFGSSQIAFNVATSGYGLLGIGFGQFHFFYTPLFSPDYLLYSKEALDQMSNFNDSRASTFNLPLRILVETGVGGLFLFLMLIYRIFSKFHNSKDPVTQVGLLFLAGSLGFLLTQDSYCLPSLAFALALVITQKRALLKK